MQTLCSVGPSLRQRHVLSCTLPRLTSSICKIFAVAALAVATPFIFPTAARAQVAESVVPLSEHTPPQILEGNATRIGHYNPEQKLRLTLSIKPPRLAEEEQFLRELVDRKSPNFHKFLSSEEWDARFAPSAADEQAVVDWAISQGFTVTHRFDHRLLVDVEAPAAVIEKAFGVTINQYQYRDEVDFSNDHDPAIPAHLQGILFNIEGLNNIQRDHGSRPGPQSKAADYAEGPAYASQGEHHADAKPGARPPSGAFAASPDTSNDSPNSTLFTNGYANPTEIYSSQVYNYDGLQNLGHCCNPHNDSGGTPNVSNIAIAAFGNFNGSDITGFAAAYPYLAYDYSSYQIDGAIDCTSDPGDCPSGETTQDLEWTIATANSFGSYLDTSHIYVYVGGNYNNNTFTDMYGYMLSDNYARVFTTSWSCTEVYGCSTSTMDARHNVFNKMLGQGWTLIAASGDRGSSDDCYLPKGSDTYDTAHEAVAYPGSDFDVLAAGGTFLMVYSDGSWDYEHAWQGGTYFGACGQNNGGSGGGISSYYTKPGFEGYSTWNGSSMRQSPDISLNAIGIGQNLFINGNLQCCANGTSIVAPELAGFFAQENAYLNYIGHVCGSAGTDACTPVGPPMQFFYPAAYYNDASHFPFYDMTGDYCNSNDVTISQGLGYYCTGAGWDNVTGWGSANMLQLAWAINWYLIPASGIPYLTFTGGPATGKWYNSDQQISWTVHDYGGGTYPGTGIAGFTQGWDSITPDSTSEPHGGTNDTFYWGPEYPNFTNGCMTLVGNAVCPGGVSQGCHTAYVRGWNNQGWTTGVQSYGPVCYDTVAPKITFTPSPSTSGSLWVNKSVTVTLTASDPGGRSASGIYQTYYGINTGNCYPGNVGGCSVYNGPFTISAQGQTYIYFFTEDNAGNFSTETYRWVSIDETPPTTKASLSGTVYKGSTYQSAVNVTLSASDPGGSGVQTTYYQVDGGSTVTYPGSAFTVSTVGAHTVTFWSVDVAGNTETNKTVSFTVSSPTSAAVVATPNPSLLGNPVTMTATVTSSFCGTPTGSVTFWNGATNLGTGTLSAGGTTSLTTTALPAGDLTLQVSYLGAGNCLPTNSFPFDQTVEQRATLSSPTPSTTLAGPSVPFSWSASPGATGYKLWIGTAAGKNNLYSSGAITTTTATPTNLPVNGEAIYVTLVTVYGTSQLSNAYTFTAATQAALTSPTPSTTLAGPSVPFTWSASAQAIEYKLLIGTTAGASNLYNSGVITSTTATPGSLPTNGETVYVTLDTLYGAGQATAAYTFTAATKAALTSPTPNTTLAGAQVTFNWTAAPGSTAYKLWIGSAAGKNDLYSSGAITLTTATPTHLPTNGETVYVTLVTVYGAAQATAGYTFTAAN